MSIKKLRKQVLVIFLITLTLTVACQRKIVELDQNCQVVDSGVVTTCIPEQWTRLVTLDMVSLENAIALDILPTGAVTSNLSSHLEEKLTHITDIGKQGEPSLEGIVSLNPELIIGLDAYQNIHAQLEQIAPAWLFAFEHSGKWKEVFLNISQALGKTETGNQLMENYYERLAEFKTKMGDRLGETKVSLMRIYPEQISIYLRDSFPGVILQDAGLSRPQSQDLGAQDAISIAQNPIQMFISPELLTQVDADVIFIWTAENESELNQNAQAQLSQLETNPLWQKLEAVKQGRVYHVPSYWVGSGPIAANLVINDLFKYLVNNQEETTI